MSDNKSPLNETTIILRNVRGSFMKVFKPEAQEEGKTPKFSSAFIMDKRTNAEDIAKVKAAMKAAAMDKNNVFKGNPPPPNKLHLPLKDGSEVEYDGYGEDTMFINASSTRRPSIVDQHRAPIAESDGIVYSGAYYDVCVKFFAYDATSKKGKKGISCELCAIQFKKDGESLGGGAPIDPNEVFDAADGETPAAKAGGNSSLWDD